MAAEYYLLVKNRAGAKVAVITDYHWLTYRKVVNAPGVLDFELDADHPAISTFELDGQIEVWRRNPDYGIGWYADFYAFYRPDEVYHFTDHDLFQTKCPGQMHLLSRRYVMWYADIGGITKFSAIPAETIMKTLVDYNASANATVANGRIREGNISTITIEADTGAGNILSWSAAWKPLLSELQDLSEAGGGDFDLIKTGDATWQFRWYTGQRGTNRTATVVFALQFGNMKEPSYSRDRIGEKTVAVVGGEGETIERRTVVTTGPDYDVNLNNIEVFVDARDIKSSPAALTSRGDTKLQDYRSRHEFDFKVIQTAASAYGQHYFLGDLVRARYRDIVQDVKVQAVTVSYQPQGEEKIDVDMLTPQSP